MTDGALAPRHVGGGEGSAMVLGRHEGTKARRHAGGKARRAFTLLETMLALIIIGVGVLAFVDAQTSFVKSNGWSSHAATAQLLANEIREMTRRLPRHDPVTGLFLTSTGTGLTLSGWGSEAGEVTAQDIDDIDDLDGKVFGTDGNLPGPIDAFGEVIPGVDMDGNILRTRSGDAIALEGWTQRVAVEKIDPYNANLTRADAYTQPATSQLPAIAVDGFPLKVTVVVEYMGPTDNAPHEVTRVTWIVPN